jgi:hypothetical protein
MSPSAIVARQGNGGRQPRVAGRFGCCNLAAVEKPMKQPVLLFVGLPRLTQVKPSRATERTVNRC